MKKEKGNVDDFLRFLIDSVPNIEPSPFFASRVAHRAELERPVYFLQVFSFSRRALPLLVSLCLFTLLLTFVLTPGEIQNGTYVDQLFEQEEEIAPVTVEDVLSALIPPDSEGVTP